MKSCYSCHSFKIQGCDKVHCGNLVTMFVQPCDNLVTTLSQPCDSLKIQGCAKVVTRLHCGNLVTMFGQPCDNLATTLSQPCDSFKIQGCAKVVTTLSFLYGTPIIFITLRLRYGVWS